MSVTVPGTFSSFSATEKSIEDIDTHHQVYVDDAISTVPLLSDRLFIEF
jgi:hypothetical protein